MTFVVAVLAVAGAAFFVTVTWHSRIAGILVPGVLFAGGIGAFVKTYRGGVPRVCGRSGRPPAGFC